MSGIAEKAVLMGLSSSKVIYLDTLEVVGGQHLLSLCIPDDTSGMQHPESAVEGAEDSIGCWTSQGAHNCGTQGGLHAKHGSTLQVSHSAECNGLTLVNSVMQDVWE
jgi:hypothetical protein